MFALWAIPRSGDAGALPSGSNKIVKQCKMSSPGRDPRHQVTKAVARGGGKGELQLVRGARCLLRGDVANGEGKGSREQGPRVPRLAPALSLRKVLVPLWAKEEDDGTAPCRSTGGSTRILLWEPCREDAAANDCLRSTSV